MTENYFLVTANLSVRDIMVRLDSRDVFCDVALITSNDKTKITPAYGTLGPHRALPFIIFKDTAGLIVGFSRNANSRNVFSSHQLSRLPKIYMDNDDLTSSFFNTAMNARRTREAAISPWPKLTLATMIKSVNIKNGSSVRHHPRTVYNCEIKSVQPNLAPNPTNAQPSELIIRPSLLDVKSIAILRSKLNTGYSIYSALDLQYNIKLKRVNALKGYPGQLSDGFVRCIDDELLKFKNIFQKYILCYTNLNTHNLATSYDLNPLMQASFNRKKRHNPDFDIHSKKNQETWLNNQREKITKQIAELDVELNGWQEKFPTIFGYPSPLLFKNNLQGIIHTAGIDANNSLTYSKVQGEISKYCSDIRERIMNNMDVDEPFKSNISKELRKEVEIEVLTPDNYHYVEIPYLEITTFGNIIELQGQFRGERIKEIIGCCLHDNNKFLLNEFVLKILFSPDLRRLLLGIIESYSSEEKNVFFKNIYFKQVFDEFLKEHNFLEYLISIDYKDPIFQNNKKQLIDHLITIKNFTLIKKLFTENKITPEDIHNIFKIDGQPQPGTKSQNLFVSEIKDNFFIISRVITNISVIDNSLVIWLKSGFKRGPLIILENIIKGSIDDQSKITAFHFMQIIFAKGIIEKEIFIQFLSKYFTDEKNKGDAKLFIQFSVTKKDDDNKSMDLFVELLKSKKVSESDIFIIPQSIPDKEIFYENLNYIASRIEIEGSRSLTQYLISTRNYKMLNYFLQNSSDEFIAKILDPQDLSKIDQDFIDEALSDDDGRVLLNCLIENSQIDHAELRINELSAIENLMQTDSGKDLLKSVIKKYQNTDLLASLNDENFKKFVCYCIDKKDVSVLKILLEFRNIENDEEIVEGITLLNYAFLYYSLEMLEYLSKPRSVELGMEVADEVLVEPDLADDFNNKIEIYQVPDPSFYDAHRVKSNFCYITEGSIDQLIDSIKPDQKKITLSNLFWHRTYQDTVQDKVSEPEYIPDPKTPLRRKLIEFFTKLNIKNLENIEEIDLSNNGLDLNYIYDRNIKDFFGKVKKINFRNNRNFFKLKQKGIESFFAVLENYKRLDTTR